MHGMVLAFVGPFDKGGMAIAYSVRRQDPFFGRQKTRRDRRISVQGSHGLVNHGIAATLLNALGGSPEQTDELLPLIIGRKRGGGISWTRVTVIATAAAVKKVRKQRTRHDGDAEYVTAASRAENRLLLAAPLA